MRSTMPNLLVSLSLILAIAAFGGPLCARAPESAVADVVVIVDTSTSMREEGMDPQWASLLVTKLFTDIVPGELAVVRLLDLVADSDVLPGRDTGRTEPCDEDPSRQCGIVEPATDWEADARRLKLGALVRPARGDAGFKSNLEQHLERRINNSLFALALRAGQGIFEEHQAARGRPAGIPRSVIWLSDGRSVDPDGVRRAIRDLVAQGVAVEAIIFGRGDIRLARDAGLEVRQVSNPAEIMKAFAGAFRRVVQAPYEIDNLVAAQPRFEIEKYVDEAWIVVYGDATLGEVELAGPAGTVRADHAADRWPTAGAYRVAYLERPAAGGWTVRAEGGGSGLAYAVVQRSALGPVLLEPGSATSGTEVALIAGVRAGREGENLITDPELLRDLTYTAELQGRTVTLRDDGTGGDPTPGDGRYAALVTFRGAGRVPVELRLTGGVVDRSLTAEVEITGEFRYAGGPLEIDLGTLGVASESCRPLDFTAEHRGEIPFELRRLRRLPGNHTLALRWRAGTLEPGGDPLPLLPDDRPEVCLTTSPNAPFSEAAGEPWLELRVAGSDAAEQVLTLHLRWQVQGLGFWQRWKWLILTILAVLAVAFVAGGFIVPHRFRGSLAVTYVPERDELDEQTPQPVKQWKGVRIGFYRNARAYLHPDFRLSGNSQGALAGLHARSRSIQVVPGRSMPLARETLDGDWEAVPPQGRPGRPGDVFRIGDNGPYFRLATHRGRG